MAHTDHSLPCSPDEHNFLPKRQTTISAANKGNYVDISELYCTKCGQVMLLKGAESDEPRVITPRRSN